MNTPIHKQPIMGRHSYGTIIVRSGCFSNQPKVIVGNFCSIATGCLALLGCGHDTTLISTFPFDKKWNYKGINTVTTKGDIIIGSDVWIGQNVTLMSGITIGDGAIIGAGSVVAKSIEPYGIAVGNPARVVKKRFTDEQINELLKIKWWNWPDAKIRNFLKYIMNNDIDKFIKIATT